MSQTAPDSAQVQQHLFAEAFFQKVASHGHVPQDPGTADLMLRTGQALYLKHAQAQQAQHQAVQARKLTALEKVANDLGLAGQQAPNQQFVADADAYLETYPELVDILGGTT